MKRNILLYYILAVCSGLMVGCQEELTEKDGSSRAVTIRLNSQSMTRAVDEPGIDPLNENKVTTVDVFFFSNQADASAYYEEDVTVTDNEFQIVLPNELEGEDYYVGIIANCDLTNVEGKTWSELLAQTLTTDFKAGNEAEGSFVMQGISGPLLLISGGKVGPIILKRVASKISLYPVIPQEILENGKNINGIVYKPNLAGASVTLRNLAIKASLDGTTYKPVAADLKAINRTYKQGGDMTGLDNNYSHLPLYSYPTDWTAEGSTETYLELCIPWSYTRDGTQMSSNYYYLVPIGEDKKLKSNAFYYIKANIDVLGSLDPEETVRVEGEFVIRDWTTLEIDAEMNRYEYLMLETNHVELNNEAKSTIFLASSSVASARVVSVTYPDYSKVESTTQNENTSGYHVEINGQSLTFEHDIDPAAFTPRTITIEVTNNDEKTEILTIVQNPAIYVVAENNDTQNGDNQLNRFVYGENSTGRICDDRGEKRYYTLGGVNNFHGGGFTNSNPNQYTIYVTVLDKDADYVIGDPREATTTQLTDLNNVAGGLKSYRRTKDTEEARRMIAPSFKIASSWGVVSSQWGILSASTNYEQLQKRCASYQENGYPAGRWRIPTEGEIEYVVSLSTAGYIPKLFGGDYFASSGRYYDTNKNNGKGGFSDTEDRSGIHTVRCVYDVWYWGDDKIADPYVFTWGDEPIN